jgi:cytochrome c biogenesis protein CcmG/thiol:disulfide interchange protein DsbE
MTAETERAEPTKKRRNLLVLLPLVFFLLLAGVFMAQLLSGRDESIVPSALIGEPVPPTDLPPLEGTSLPGLASSDFQGKVTLVNVWGSWCVPCRQEHPLLMVLARDDRFVLAGLNYKDKPENALRFLGEAGNPFAVIGVDQSGRTAIDWGVYGVPETFLVGRDGAILYKHVGPFTPESITSELMPRVEKALSASQ